MKIALARLGLVALMVGTLAGCGGGGGDSVPTTDTGTVSSTLTPAPIPPGNTTIDASTLTPEQFAALQPQVVVADAEVASPPQVSFAIQDPNGNPIIGLGPYLRFSMAKLVPGASVAGTTTTTPSKWVNYIVISSSGAAQRPNAETNGTLVDNGNGTYVYTFATDVRAVKDQIAAMTFTGDNKAADLGDLTFDPNLTHRLTVQLSGRHPNADPQDPDMLMDPANAIYDFIPATGNPITATDTQRQVVSIENCNECHNKLAIHGAARIDTQYCVVCHTDQRRYGRPNVASTNLAFPALTETVTTDPDTLFKSYRYTPATYVGDGETMGDFPRMVHKIHSGHSLLKQNYNYANVAFNLIGFSMLDDGQRMCTKCHDNGKAAQADNWKNVPSTIACGACHDGINFATGTGTTLAGATTGHVAGAQPDTRCALCHDGSNIPIYHQTENKTEHNPTIPAGLVTFTYDVQSAAVDAATNNVTVNFKISKDGAALTTLPPTGFTGSPSFLLAWADPQDGIATPTEFNNSTRTQAQAISRSISGLLAGTNGSITGPDAGGYFTATLSGTAGTDVFPVGAKMRTVALQGYYTQAAGTNGIAANTARHALSVVKTVTGDTARRKVIDPAKCGNCHEWFEAHGGNRVIGKETVGDGAVCVLCHVPGLATSGRGIADTVVNTYTSTGPGFSAEDLKILTEWGLSTTFPVVVGSNWALGLPVTSNNFKDLIHGIHKGRERVNPFQDARDRTPSAITLLDFRRMNFPGIIDACETCHLAGSYSNVSASALASTHESVNIAGNTTTALAKSALAQPNPTDTVTSPFAAACVSCHDSATAKNHMQISGGGQIMVQRSAFVAGQEQCAFCHGPGKIVDIAVVHNR